MEVDEVARVIPETRRARIAQKGAKVRNGLKRVASRARAAVYKIEREQIAEVYFESGGDLSETISYFGQTPPNAPDPDTVIHILKSLGHEITGDKMSDLKIGANLPLQAISAHTWLFFCHEYNMTSGDVEMMGINTVQQLRQMELLGQHLIPVHIDYETMRRWSDFDEIDKLGLTPAERALLHFPEEKPVE